MGNECKKFRLIFYLVLPNVVEAVLGPYLGLGMPNNNIVEISSLYQH